MPLPRRPAPYILGLLILLLMVIVAWIYQAVTSPEIREAVRKKKVEQPYQRPGPPPLPPLPSPPAPIRPSASTLDPGIKEMAEELHKPENAPERDLQIVSQLLQEYRRVFQGNPAGNNQDITTALLGGESGPGRFLPRGLGAIKNGELVDRWGTPYWFHSNTGDRMEIRSAGPDRQLFTGDDVVNDPSPAGLGATPTGVEGDSGASADG